MRTISQKQFNDLQEHLEYEGVDTVFLMKLQYLTGITAHPYTAYSLYDENDEKKTDDEIDDEIIDFTKNAFDSIGIYNAEVLV